MHCLGVLPLIQINLHILGKQAIIHHIYKKIYGNQTQAPGSGSSSNSVPHGTHVR